MLRLVSAILISLAVALVAPPVTGGVTHDPGASPLAIRVHVATSDRAAYAVGPPQRFKLPSLVGMKVAVGYHEQYRPSAWVPVRVALHNYATEQLRGTVTIPDGGGGSQYSNPSFTSLYSESVVLPPSATKHITLYLPGQDVGDTVNVQFRLGTQIVARGMDSPASTSDRRHR